jgi:hypothetical protein
MSQWSPPVQLMHANQKNLKIEHWLHVMQLHEPRGMIGINTDMEPEPMGFLSTDF